MCILITDTNIKSGAGNEVELTATYTVSVYATKPGYENSDVVTKQINVGGVGTALKGDVNGDGKVDIVDVTTTIDIILGKTK